jgi:2-methylcitrate dehydratase
LLSRLEHGQIIPLSEVNSSYIARGQLAQAISLAINDHIPLGQTRVQALSDWNGLADAEAGRNAVFAARLARAGLTGPAPIFEGGFFKQVSGPADVEVGAFGRRGVPFRIHQCGMKAYPAVVYAQTAIAAGIEVVARRVGSLDRVTAIEIATDEKEGNCNHSAIMF